MDYTKLLRDLLKEATQFEQYKRLGVLSQILATICMLPIIAIDLVLIAQFFVIDFILKGLSAPFEILHQFVKKERGEVRHATEAVIYAITLPFLFIYHIYIALFSFYFYLSWFLIMVFTYLATLGGIRWQPFIMDAKFDGERDQYIYMPYEDVAGLLIFVNFAAIIAYFVFIFLGRYSTEHEVYLLYTACSSLSWFVYWFMLLIVTPIAFRKIKKIDKSNAKDSEKSTNNTNNTDIEESYYAQYDKSESVNTDALKAEITAKETKQSTVDSSISKGNKTEVGALKYQLHYALQYNTIDGMTAYLSNIDDERVKNILQQPKDKISDLVKELYNSLG